MSEAIAEGRLSPGRLTALARPRFRPQFVARVVPGEATYLISEKYHYALQGEIVQALAPYLDGEHATDEIVTALAERYPPERVYHSLTQLRARGYVIEAGQELDPGHAALWEATGVDGGRATACIAALTCRVEWAIDNADANLAAAVRDALTAGGARICGPSEEPGLAIVLADDYLNPRLAGYNQAYLEQGRPWLLSKPTGTRIWIGPLFSPGQSGCWECMAARLRRNRMVESYVEQRTGHRLIPSIARSRTAMALAAQLIALRAQRWSASHAESWAAPDTGAQPYAADYAHTHVEEYALLTGEVIRHEPVRRPQCLACGKPSLQSDLGRTAVTLADHVHAVASDGGLRARTAEQTAAELARLVSPVTGVVSDLEPFTPAAGLLPAGLVHTYTAGHNFALNTPHLHLLREGMRSRAAGKGVTDAQAKAGAICEAIERYSGLYHGDEARIRASYRDLGDAAIHPNAVALFSDRQYTDRATWNNGDNSFAYVGVPLRQDCVMDWSPVWPLAGGRQRYLPTMQLYYFYPKTEENTYVWADSNGCAAGSSPEDALLQGMLELVERDAVAVWWYNQLRRPAVDLASFADEYASRCAGAYRALRRSLHVLDLTHDLKVPVFAAVSRRLDKQAEDIIMAFGAHLDPRVALRRCLTELNQFLPAVIEVAADDTGYQFPDPVQQHWWRTARLADLRYLIPQEEIPPVRCDDHPNLCTGDIAQDLRGLITRLSSFGLDAYAVNQTRPDIGVPVYKAIVPGLRHFWARFAPGRLYDVPVQLGWLDAPTPEDRLNPIPMFL